MHPSLSFSMALKFSFSVSEKTVVPLTRRVSAGLGGIWVYSPSCWVWRVCVVANPPLTFLCSLSCHIFPHLPSAKPSPGMKELFNYPGPRSGGPRFYVQRVKGKWLVPAGTLPPGLFPVCEGEDRRWGPPIHTAQASNSVEIGSQSRDTARGAATTPHL